MTLGDTFEADILKLIFQAIAIANIADNAASSPAGAITVALHTADPGEAGSQGTSETAYTGYTRVSVSRTTSGWAISGSTISPSVNIDFTECAGSPGNTLTHWSVGTGTSNKMIGSGTLNPVIVVATGVIPRIKTSSTIVFD